MFPLNALTCECCLRRDDGRPCGGPLPPKATTLESGKSLRNFQLDDGLACCGPLFPKAIGETTSPCSFDLFATVGSVLPVQNGSGKFPSVL